MRVSPALSVSVPDIVHVLVDESHEGFEPAGNARHDAWSDIVKLAAYASFGEFDNTITVATANTTKITFGNEILFIPQTPLAI